MASQRSYEILIYPDSTQILLLDKFALQWNTVQRRLYKSIRQNPDLDFNLAKRNCIANDGLTGRHFNSIRDDLKGKIASVLELDKTYLDDVKSKLKSLKKTRKSLELTINALQKDICNTHLSVVQQKSTLRLSKKQTTLFKISTRILKLEKRNQQLESDIKNKNPRLCFGSKRLFNKQFNTKDLGLNNPNQYNNHLEWKAAWQPHRNASFIMIGSKDETAGNSNCQLHVDKNHHYSLKINLGSQKIIIPTRLSYGDRFIEQALVSNQALTYRFNKQANGVYKVRVSLDVSKQLPVIKTNTFIGAVGIDINENHLALTVVDQHGNKTTSFNISLNLYGKSSDQASAIIGDAVKQIIQVANEKSLPIVIEKLNFQLKKRTLQSDNKTNRYKRMISSFSYNKIISNIKARAEDNGIQVIDVNPAYTSIIGKIKYKDRLAITVHQAAAFTIARRGLGFNEKALRNRCKHVTYAVPARNQYKQSDAYWNAVSKIREHEAHYSSRLRSNNVKLNDFAFGSLSTPSISMPLRDDDCEIKDIFT